MNEYGCVIRIIRNGELRAQVFYNAADRYITGFGAGSELLPYSPTLEDVKLEAAIHAAVLANLIAEFDQFSSYEQFESWFRTNHPEYTLEVEELQYPVIR